MGTFNPQRPEQAPNSDVQQPAASQGQEANARMYNDAYARQAIQAGPQAMEQQLSQVVGHLQNAEQLMETQGIGAAKNEYLQAINNARGLNETQLSQERTMVEQALKSGNLDDQTRRTLMQEDMDLHMLQRAPGMALANFALANIRSGNETFGVQLLSEASKLDPEMAKDPNFQRHLRSALQAGARLEPQQDQPTQQYQPGQPGGPGQYAPQQPGQPGAAPGSDTSQQPGVGPRTDASQQPGANPAAQGDNTAALQQAQLQGRNPNDAAAAAGPSPVEQVQALYQQVTGPQSMTPDVQQKFVHAIQQADSGASPKLAQLQAQQAQIVEAMKPLMSGQTGQQLQQLDTAVRQELSKLPQAQQQQALPLYMSMANATSPQDRQAAEQKLSQMVPSLQNAFNAEDRLLTPQGIQGLTMLNKINSDAQDEKNQSAITRFAFSMALAKAGDSADAQALMVQALQKNNNKDLTQNWIQAAEQIGVPAATAQQAAAQAGGDVATAPRAAVGTTSGDQSATPGATGQPRPGDGTTAQTLQGAVQQGLNGAEVQTPGQAAPGAATGQPGEVAQAGNAAMLNAQDNGQSAGAIFQEAQLLLKQKGMTQETKNEFQDAITAAKNSFSASDAQQSQQIEQILQSGKMPDGTDMTAAQRLQAHQLLAQEFSNASSALIIEAQYGQALLQSKQYASAEGVFKGMVSDADKLPTGLMAQEYKQLQTDIKNPQLNLQQQSQLNQFAQSIIGDGTSSNPGSLYLGVTARQALAEFYVSGAAQKGAPVKPDQAMAALNDAANKEKSIQTQYLGVAADKYKPSSQLSAMEQQLQPMLPENLRKQQQTANSFWSNALIDGGTAATAIGVAGIAASLLTHNEAFANIGKTIGAVGRDTGELTLGGKALLGGLAFTGDVAARNGLHTLVTGDHESLTTSAIHSAAGLAAVGGVLGMRASVGNFLFRGASESGALEGSAGAFFAKDAATAAKTGGVLKDTMTVGDLEAFTGKALPRTAGIDSSTILATRGAENAGVLTDDIISRTADGGKVFGLTGAQNAELTHTALANQLAKGATANKGVLGGIKSFGGAVTGAVRDPLGAASDFGTGVKNTFKGMNPLSSLDLTSGDAAALKRQLGMRSFYSGYSSAVGGLAGYNTVTALDAPVDPKTGKPMSFGEAFMHNNFSSLKDNDFTNALYMFPFLKDGQIARAAVENPNAWQALKGGVGKVFSPLSSTGFGASSDMTRQAFRIATVGTLASPNTLNNLPFILESKQIGQALHTMDAPITDESAPAPQAAAPEAAAATPQPAGSEQTGTAPGDTQTTGSLTAGTPGLQ